MSLERRIEALEKSFGTEPSPAEEHLEERRCIIAELEELEASCKERIRQRTSPHSS